MFLIGWARKWLPKSEKSLAVKKIRTALNNFSTYDAISSMSPMISLLESTTDERVIPETVESLRKQLRAIESNTENEKIINNGVSLAQAAYDALLALAAFKPINEECLVFSNNIPNKKKVFVSSGHQYDVVHLIKHHNVRPFQQGEDFEKKLRDYYHTPFSPRDVAHILEVAKENKIEIRAPADVRQPPRSEPIRVPNESGWLNSAWLRFQAIFSEGQSSAEINRQRDYNANYLDFFSFDLLASALSDNPPDGIYDAIRRVGISCFLLLGMSSANAFFQNALLTARLYEQMQRDLEYLKNYIPPQILALFQDANEISSRVDEWSEGLINYAYLLALASNYFFPVPQSGVRAAEPWGDIRFFGRDNQAEQVNSEQNLRENHVGAEGAVHEFNFGP